MNLLAVDWDLCESNGSCVAAAPRFFDIDDDDRLQLPEGLEVSDVDLPDVQLAIQLCPKRALTIQRDV